MTGGQPVDSPFNVDGIARRVEAGGVKRVGVVNDDIGKYAALRSRFRRVPSVATAASSTRCSAACARCRVSRCRSANRPVLPKSAAAARARRPAAAWPTHQRVAALPLPTPHHGTAPHDLLILGVGGTGVETVGPLITMAAHLEGKQASVLDLMGFVQKGGAVLCFVRPADQADRLHPVRIDAQQADAVLACDLAVAAWPEALLTLRHGWQCGLVPVGWPRCNARSP